MHAFYSKPVSHIHEFPNNGKFYFLFFLKLWLPIQSLAGDSYYRTHGISYIARFNECLMQNVLTFSLFFVLQKISLKILTSFIYFILLFFPSVVSIVWKHFYASFKQWTYTPSCELISPDCKVGKKKEKERVNVNLKII